MKRTIVSLVLTAAIVALWPQLVDARGCGGTRYGGEYHGSGSGGGYHSGGSAGGSRYASGSDGSAAERGGASYHSFGGPHGTTVEHGTAAAQGAAVGPEGGAAGGKAVTGTKVTTPSGQTYTHTASAGRGAETGPEGAEAGRYGTTSSSYQSGSGQYSHGATGYSTASTSLPTDAGQTAATTGTTATAATRTTTTATTGTTTTGAYAGYHQTVATNGNVYAARGAVVRSGYPATGMYTQGWYAAHPNTWAPTGWTAGTAWQTTTWPAAGAAVGIAPTAQPVSYNYGTNVTYQGGQVYYGQQPVASAEQYYQQASDLAQSGGAPDPQSGDWMPLGVFGLVRGEQSEPHYLLHLAINKAGVVGGNYTDNVSGTTHPIQGAVDKKTQRVAWTVGSNKNTVAETGLYNLTQDEAPVLLHLGKDRTQQWLLVRLKQRPEEQGQQ